MNATLITIGDEILAGITVDTNSNFIAGQLNAIGIQVAQILTISDSVPTIVKTLKMAFQTSDLVITTGGLGPTKDDKTKKAYAEFFQDDLVFDEVTFNHLKDRLQRIGRMEILEKNREQAMVLSKGEVFQNFYGTAPSLKAERNGKIAICLPGVPFEVKPLMIDQIIPFLAQKFKNDHLITRTISVINFPESALSEHLENWELSLPKFIALAYLPFANRVRLKMVAKGPDRGHLESELENQIDQLRTLLDGHILSENGDKIEEILHDVLVQKQFTISVAESVTGGELAHLITSVSGSSQYFLGGVVAYDYHKKIEILGVSEQTIKEKTVVSEEVAQEMSLGAQRLFNTSISISTTGVAGPNSDEFNNEIGTVFYSIRVNEFEKTFRLHLPYLQRKDFMNFVAQKALQDLINILINLPS